MAILSNLKIFCMAELYYLKGRLQSCVEKLKKDSAFLICLKHV